jgi:hypothetical protein
MTTDNDYRQFTRAELLEALSNIDAQNFPRNHQHLVAEIAARDRGVRPEIPSKRPERISRLAESCTEAEHRLVRTLGVDSRPRPEPISPWNYELALLSGNEMQSSDVSAAWIVARHYNAAHLKARRPLWWHLSGAALTIWLTRKWPSEVILCEASILSSSSHGI